VSFDGSAGAQVDASPGEGGANIGHIRDADNTARRLSPADPGQRLVVPTTLVAVTPTKQALRRTVLAARRSMDAANRAAAGLRFADQVATLPSYPSFGGVVAAYSSRHDEPATDALLERLVKDGITVLLPVLRPDLDLGWGPYDPAHLAVSELDIAEPTGDVSSPDAILNADLLVCPGLAVDHLGRRLGRGGGSYDRVLARYGKRDSTCVLVYDDEIRDDVPYERHDRRIGWIVTPARILDTQLVRR
jgi:5-formyltetrahydrofolate cyclo-ligase